MSSWSPSRSWRSQRADCGTHDGETYEVDTIVYGTGFKANEYLSTIDVTGVGGSRLHENWKEGAEAYLGLSVPGYPNFFMLYGPNTNGMTSIIFLLEAQVHFVMGAIRTMRRLDLGALDVRPRAFARYNEDIQSRMDTSVWTAGCTNYFRAPSGKVVTQLPYSAARYWARTRVFPIWSYRASRRVDSR